MAFLAGLPFFMFTRRLVPGFREMLIPASTAPAVRHQNSLARRSQIRQRFSGLIVEDQRADRDPQNHFVTGVAGAVGSFAVAPAVGFEFAVVSVAQQCVVVGICFQVDAAAMATVPARGAATRHEFFAAERDAAVTSTACFYENFGFVDEHSELRCASGRTLR